MVAAQYRFNAGFLKRTELAPTERVDDVVLNKRIKSFERAHRFRRMSSTDAAGVRFLSSSVISSSRMVSW